MKTEGYRPGDTPILWSEWIFGTAGTRKSLCAQGIVILNWVQRLEKQGKTQHDIYCLAKRKFPVLVKTHVITPCKRLHDIAGEKARLLETLNNSRFSDGFVKAVTACIEEQCTTEDIDFNKDFAEPIYDKDGDYAILWDDTPRNGKK